MDQTDWQTLPDTTDPARAAVGEVLHQAHIDILRDLWHKADAYDRTRASLSELCDRIESIAELLPYSDRKARLRRAVRRTRADIRTL